LVSVSRRVLILAVASVLALLVFAAVLAYAFVGFLRAPRPYVALLELSGVIDYERPLLGGAITPRDVEELVRIVERDPWARAVVLVVNSPGGTMAAFEVYELIKKLSSERVVVAYIMGLGTSGGYLIALPAREIVAHPTALVGSVGAVAIITSYKGLLEKLGVNVTTVKSGDLKDVGSPYREVKDEDLRVVEAIVRDTAKLFLEKVREHRGDKIRDYTEIARAGVYTGLEAEKLGLVDRTGTLEEAVKRARELANLPPDTPLVRVERKVSILDILLGRVQQPITTPAPRKPLSIEVLLIWPLPLELAENTTATRVTTNS